ncbi:hypothetical protein ACWFQ8_32750 [Streptomyces sp. NPDC055254]
MGDIDARLVLVVTVTLACVWLTHRNPQWVKPLSVGGVVGALLVALLVLMDS